MGYFSPFAEGSGSGLDADTLDGQDSTELAASSHTHDGGDIVLGTVVEPRIDDDIARDAEVAGIVKGADGAGSGVDGDFLDGKHASAFRPRPQNVLQVAKGGSGDFTTISAALASITDAGASNRYLIEVAPGTYPEQVAMKPYVDIAGAGEELTLITSATAPTLSGASDAELRHLEVECTGGASSVAIRNLNASPKLTHVVADASGGITESIAVLNDGASAAPVLDHVTAYAGAVAVDIGVVNQNGAAPVIRHSSLSGTAAAVENRDTATAQIAHTALMGGAAVMAPASQASYMCVRAFVASTLARLGPTCTAPPVAFDDSYDSLGNTLLEVTLDHAGAASTVNTTITEPSVIGDASPAKTYRSVLENDTDADTAKSLLTAAVVPATITAGAAVTMFSDGTFEYLPPPGFTGVDTFDYTVTEPSGLRDTGTVTVSVANLLWYVDNTAGTGGSGRSDSRFDQLTDLGPAADRMGDLIYVFQGSGDTTCGHNLLGNQLLIGQGLDLDAGVLAALSGYQYAGTDNTVLVESAARPTLSVGTLVDCVTVAAGNTIRGIDFGSTLGGQHRIAGSAVGALTVNASSIASLGGVIQISTGGTLAVTFDSITSTSSFGAPAIDVTGVGGSFTVTDLGGTDTAISGAAAGISVQGSGGAVFSFGDTTVSSSGDGVNLGEASANAGASFTFESLSVTASGSGDGLVAKNSGTLNINSTDTGGDGFEDLNEASVGSGTAVNISSTTIGAAGIQFKSVSANGGTSPGIILDTTGSGAFTVTGASATVGSGGTIENMAADGVTLKSTGGAVAFRRMIFEDIGNMAGGLNTVSGHDAIHGENVLGGLTIDNTTIRRVSDMAIHGEPLAAAGFTTFDGLVITGSTIEDTNRYHMALVGDDNNEAMVRLRGLKGTVTVIGSTLRRGAELLDVSSTSSIGDTLTMTVQSNSFADSFKGLSAALGAKGLACINVKMRGDADAVIHIGDPAEASAALGNSFTGCATVGIAIKHDDPSASGDIDAIISRNTLDNKSSLPGQNCDGINNCSPFGFGNWPQTSILLRQRGTSASTLDAIVSHNVLTEPGTAEGNEGSITAFFDGVPGGTVAGSGQVRISDNTVTGPFVAGFFVLAENNTGAKVLFEDNQIVGCDFNAAPGLCPVHPDFGPTPSPGNSSKVRTIENGRIQATVRDHGATSTTSTSPGFPEQDIIFTEPPSSSFKAEARGNGLGGGSDAICLAISNNSSDRGYELRRDGGTFDLYRGVSSATGGCSTAAPGNCQTVLDDNGNTGGLTAGIKNPTKTPPDVAVTGLGGTISNTGTACALPSGTITGGTF